MSDLDMHTDDIEGQTTALAGCGEKRVERQLRPVADYRRISAIHVVPADC